MVKLKPDNKLLLFLCFFTCVAAAGGVFAQSSALLEEVVVTAQRRAESVQDVPITINVLSGGQLKNNVINNTFDLQAKIPGFVSTPVASYGFTYLRGIGTDQQTVGLEPAVATHIDGVYFPRVASGFQELYDVDRVEVIKGPQGTLFGRNATGGAIHVISKRPNNEFGGYLDATVGNLEKIRIEGALNTPIIEDKVLFRIAGVYHNDEGYSKNEFLNKEEDDTDIQSLRTQLLVHASDNFSIRFFGDYTNNEGGRGAASHPSEPYDNAALGIPGGDINPDVRINRRDAPADTEIEDWGIGAEIEWVLGGVTVKSLSSYRELENRLHVDFDLTPLNLSGFSDPIENSENWMQEIQLSSNSDGGLEWVVGAFIFNEDVRQDYYFPFASSVFAANPLGPAVVQGGLYDSGTSDTAIVDTFSWALFGQASYELTEKFRLTAGLRYSYDEREIDYNVFLLDIPAPATAVDLLANRPGLGVAFVTDAQKGDWDAFTPKAGIEYFYSDDIMYYFSATRGFKSGGYNGILFGAATTLEAVDPEIIWSYEAGVKSTLMEGRMRLNITGFYYDYQDIQLNILTADQAATRGFANVRNAGDADIYGAEVEVNLAVTDYFRVDGLIAYLDTELGTLLSANPNAAMDTDQSGNRLPNAPEFSLNIGAEYNWGLGDLGELSVRGDYTHRTRRYHTIYQEFFNSSASNDFLNARLSFTGNSDKWSVSVHVRNLLDEDNESFGFRAPFFGALKLYSERRNYGLNVRYKF